jgi:hypothetical protein
MKAAYPQTIKSPPIRADQVLRSYNGRVLSDHTFSTQAAKELARRFGGDLSSADWRHFGRLAGFTNQKLKRRLQNGLAPFVRLRQCEGKTYDAAHEFLEELKSLAENAIAARAVQATSRSTSTEDSVRPSMSFTGILGTAAICIAQTWRGLSTAASRGLPEQQISDEILHARDLSKKGGPGRQLNYAQRTAIKALSRGTQESHVEAIRWVRRLIVSHFRHYRADPSSK